MTILLAYFLWVISTLAVIVTVWIGVADSGMARVQPRQVPAMQQSLDAALQAEAMPMPPAVAASAKLHARRARMARLTRR